MRKIKKPQLKMRMVLRGIQWNALFTLFHTKDEVW